MGFAAAAVLSTGMAVMFSSTVQAFVTFNPQYSRGTSFRLHARTKLATSPLSADVPRAEVPIHSPPPVQVASADHPLIQLANEFVYTKSGFYSNYDESAFSSEFVFRGPMIGPLNKGDYLKTMDTFGIYRAIPDISPNAFGWSLDPKDPNRVWFLVRNTGTFTGEPGLGFGGDRYLPPNGAIIEGCPETFSITFDDDRKVKHLTVGYVADRFQGNVRGKGAAVGIMNAVGVPFPSPGPLLGFAEWFGSEVLDIGAYTYSTKDIPSWWTNEEKASEGYL